MWKIEWSFDDFYSKADVSFQMRYPKANEVVWIRKVVVLAALLASNGFNNDQENLQMRNR